MEKYFDEAASYLAKQILDPGHRNRQALILSDGKHLHKFGLGSVNRNINSAWKEHMKTVMRDLFEKKERTTCIACIDARHVKSAMEDSEAAAEFKAIILDSQHRLTALKELIEEDDKYKSYEFWVILYIVQSDEEMHKLLQDIDQRKPFDEDDEIVVNVRMRFIKAFKELTPGQETRRCVTGTLNHNVLRDPEIMEKLKLYGREDLKKLILKSAEAYKAKFEAAKLGKSALLDTILTTKLYQLIDWQSGAWIREMFL